MVTLHPRARAGQCDEAAGTGAYRLSHAAGFVTGTGINDQPSRICSCRSSNCGFGRPAVHPQSPAHDRPAGAVQHPYYWVSSSMSCSTRSAFVPRNMLGPCRRSSVAWWKHRAWMFIAHQRVLPRRDIPALLQRIEAPGQPIRVLVGTTRDLAEQLTKPGTQRFVGQQRNGDRRHAFLVRVDLAQQSRQQFAGRCGGVGIWKPEWIGPQSVCAWAALSG